MAAEVDERFTRISGELQRLALDFDRLRAENVRLSKVASVARAIAIVALVVPISVLLVATRYMSPRFNVVHANEIVVHDAEGAPRVAMTTKGASAGISVHTKDGKPSVLLTVDDQSSSIAISSRSPEPNLGVFLSSNQNSSMIQLHHKRPKAAMGSLAGYVSIESSFQDSARIGVYGASEANVAMEGSSIPGIGARVAAYGGSGKNHSAVMSATDSYPVLEMRRGDGKHKAVLAAYDYNAALDLENGTDSRATISDDYGGSGPSVFVKKKDTMAHMSAWVGSNFVALKGIDSIWASPYKDKDKDKEEKKEEKK